MGKSNGYEERLVAFIDILGFKSMVSASEVNSDEFDKIYMALTKFNRLTRSSKWRDDLVEVEESAQKKGVEQFKLTGRLASTAFSDSIVISVKVEDNINQMLSSLVAGISYIGNDLLKSGILIRGGITCGKLLNKTNGMVVGPALIEAYELESNLANYPRIILSDKIIKKLNYPIERKRNSYPYHQYLKRFRDGCVGFHQMIYNQVMNSLSSYSYDAQRDDLKTIRDVIVKGLDFSAENPRVVAKYQWMKKEYNKLYVFNENNDPDTQNVFKKINEFDEVDGGQNLHYSFVEKLVTETDWR